jgi:hypothetical protein
MIKPHLIGLIVMPRRWVLKALEMAVVAFALVLGMCVLTWSQSFIIKSLINPDSLTVGDRFLFTNTISKIDGYRIVPSPLSDSLGDATVLSHIFKVERTPTGSEVYACTLAVYKPGLATIPTFKFMVTNDSGKIAQIAGDSLRVTIHSVLPADTAGLDIADIKGPRPLRGPIWPYIVIPLALALIIFVGLRLRGILRGKVQVPMAPLRPAWEVAIERLDSLKAERHIEFGRFKQFYFELSMIVRGYLEGRYETPAVESTTYELEDDGKLKAISDDLYRRLFGFFRRADLVKFAKSIPTSREAEEDLTFAYELVIKTRPLPVELAPEEREPEKVEV